MKINIFRGDLSDISVKTATLVLSTQTQQFFHYSDWTADSSSGASGAFVGTHIFVRSDSIIRGPTVCVAGFCCLFGPSTAHFILTDYSIP